MGNHAGKREICAEKAHKQRVALSPLPAEPGSTVHAHCGDRSTSGTETQALPNPKSSIAVLSRLTLLLHFLLKQLLPL
ncbi:hypothetical protein MDA_GLEAN10025333 [Myotis davidii]|uniref:Uncharacterized protein n=1 Tax=Myotis davidii TaxID=225400 RepID=L5LZX6_MYODS|nr:hypothetical protein MDA_GLEAN10025333 [Myotis davidii]